MRLSMKIEDAYVDAFCEVFGKAGGVKVLKSLRGAASVPLRQRVDRSGTTALSSRAW